MLRYGIPDFRLPREVLDAEIGRILDLGVELKCNCAVGKDISWSNSARNMQPYSPALARKRESG